MTYLTKTCCDPRQSEFMGKLSIASRGSKGEKEPQDFSHRGCVSRRVCSMGPAIFQVRAWPSVLDGMPFTEFPLLAWGAVKLELSRPAVGKHVSEKSLRLITIYM